MQNVTMPCYPRLHTQISIMAKKRSWSQSCDMPATGRNNNKAPLRKNSLASSTCLACAQNAPTFFCDINCMSNTDEQRGGDVLRQHTQFYNGLISPPTTNPEQGEYSPQSLQEGWPDYSASCGQLFFHETMNATIMENAWSPATSSSSGDQIPLPNQQYTGPCWAEVTPPKAAFHPFYARDLHSREATCQTASTDVRSTSASHGPFESTPTLTSGVVSALRSMETSLATHTRHQLELLCNRDAIYHQNVSCYAT